MDKISSILPGNARVQSVDTENSQAARPGAPTLGRHAGITTVHDRVSLSEAARNASLQENFKDTMGGARAKDLARAKMVAEINRNFFESRIKPTAAPSPAAEETANAAMESADEFEAPQKSFDRDTSREAIIAKYSQPAFEKDVESSPVVRANSREEQPSSFEERSAAPARETMIAAE